MEKQLIYEVIPTVMSEIGSIGKDRRNQAQNYSFRGIDDVYNAVNASLAKNKVFCVPEVLEERREERQTKSGGTLIYTILKMKFTLFAVDGSSVSGITIGEAMDSGDKSANKAMSTAQKYFFFQTFCIPTEEQKDTEYESHEVKPKETPSPQPKKETPNPVIESDKEKKDAALKAISEAKNQTQIDNILKRADGYFSTGDLTQPSINEIKEAIKNKKF